MELTGVHFLLTYQCTFACDHCFVWGSPWQEGAMSLADIDRVLDQAEELGTVESVFFEGGEPFLYYATLVEGVRRAGWTALGTSFVYSLGAAALLLVFPGAIASLYRLEPSVHTLAVELLGIAVLFQVGDSIQATATGVLRGAVVDLHRNSGRVGHLPFEQVEGIARLPAHGDGLRPAPELDLLDRSRIRDLGCVKSHI